MEEFLLKLSEQVGISPDVARNGLGAVLTFLKGKLPKGLFGQVEQAVPDAQGMVDSFEANKTPESGSGLMGAVAGLAGKLLGGGAGDAGKLASMLGQSGMNMGQIAAFLRRFSRCSSPISPPKSWKRSRA